MSTELIWLEELGIPSITTQLDSFITINDIQDNVRYLNRSDKHCFINLLSLRTISTALLISLKATITILFNLISSVEHISRQVPRHIAYGRNLRKKEDAYFQLNSRGVFAMLDCNEKGKLLQKYIIVEYRHSQEN